MGGRAEERLGSELWGLVIVAKQKDGLVLFVGLRLQVLGGLRGGEEGRAVVAHSTGTGAGSGRDKGREDGGTGLAEADDEAGVEEAEAGLPGRAELGPLRPARPHPVPHEHRRQALDEQPRACPSR